MGRKSALCSLLLSHLAKETLFSYSLEQTNQATGAFCESDSWLITETRLAIPLGMALRPESTVKCPLVAIRGNLSERKILTSFLNWVLRQPYMMEKKKKQWVSSSLKNREKGFLWYQEESNVQANVCHSH